MTRIVCLTLSIVAALAIVLIARRARAARLRRLALVVFSGPKRPRPAADGDDIHAIERFLPRILRRNLRVLDIDLGIQDIAAVACVFALGVLLAGLFGGTILAIALAVTIPFAAVATLNILANRRIAELGALMPGFFDRVRQLLVIGNSLPTAFARAVHGAQPALVSFFTPAIRRIGNGAGFSETIRQSAEDIGLYEMHLFSAAVSTNMRFGGSLTHSLSNLVQFLRKRASVEREMRANTAQIRFSALVLAVLPVLVAALIISQNQEYARWFVTDPTGKWLLGYCIISQVAGVIVMRSIVKVGF